MDNSKTKFIVVTGIYSAIGTALMYFEIPWFVAGPKLGISDVVVGVAAALVSPLSAFLVAVIKSVIHYLLTGGHSGIPIGQMAAFLASISFALPLMIYRKGYKDEDRMEMKKVLIRLFYGVVSLTVVLTIANYFFITPVYMKIYDVDLPENYLRYIVGLYVPFNLVKGIIVAVICYVIINRLKNMRN